MAQDREATPISDPPMPATMDRGSTGPRPSAMDVFALRKDMVDTYRSFVQSYYDIRDERIRARVEESLASGLLWPEPLLQVNPAYESGGSIDDLVSQGVLHRDCSTVFRRGKTPTGAEGGSTIQLYRHQVESIKRARDGRNVVLTSGTGSGKSLAYIVPIVDQILRTGPGKGVQAIVVYPMNALANSQFQEMRKFLQHGYPGGKGPVTFRTYTGQEPKEELQRIRDDPPDIILTNYVMLELILTRTEERPLITKAQGLKFLVLDELHTYRGRQGADVAMLVRRLREHLNATELQVIGTSATLAGGGTADQQKAEVAKVATDLFGDTVEPGDVVQEHLIRRTTHLDFETTPANRDALAKAVRERLQPKSLGELVNHPLFSWIESQVGLREDAEGRLIRAIPQSLSGAGGLIHQLAELSGIPVDECRRSLEETLLASYQVIDPQSGTAAFAFRLHQFFSRGDTAYATLEPPGSREIAMREQRFAPDSGREKELYPLVFCRECGQEYYCVHWKKERGSETRYVERRDIGDRLTGDDQEDDVYSGFLFVDDNGSWPEDEQAAYAQLPAEWTEEGPNGIRPLKKYRKYVPERVILNPNGREAAEGSAFALIRAPFRLCLSCAVEYGPRGGDFGKLASLGTEGRSSATTILALSALRKLRASPLDESARKLLSFTDNRQDASLQSGHFNDFVEVGLLRGALYKALEEAGEAGVESDELISRILDKLKLDSKDYAADPAAKYNRLDKARKALRSVVGYRIYRDLKRGWRITAPNLEQVGLLRINYASLDEIAGDRELWDDKHTALATAMPKQRMAIISALLDHLRRELAVSVLYLDQNHQSEMIASSYGELREPWTLQAFESMERSRYMVLDDPQGDPNLVRVSSRGNFGLFLRRPGTLPEPNLKLTDTETIIEQLVSALVEGGLLERFELGGREKRAGYQIPASVLIWKAGDGTTAFHDPLRVPRRSETGGRVNPFFVDYYQGWSLETRGLEAREHTAQVPSDLRLDREDRFRSADLPLLFCSPTMELGVDIAQLNAVNLRNVPPTPANYAQRSGRAGRSGQPAFVFTYCGNFSNHDQYFFSHPEDMVAGAVTPPRLDLANEDLIRSHINAVWLHEANIRLGKTLTTVVDVEANPPPLTLRQEIKTALQDDAIVGEAKKRASRILAGIEGQLLEAGWYDERWLDDAFEKLLPTFEEACERWRELFRAARSQRDLQNRIIEDMTRSQDDKKRAERLRREAENQIEVLTTEQRVMEGDFYTYRYFASEGWLPGYNFPRLPLLAYVSGRRGNREVTEFLSRPRFLAISEFGPRAFIYHEGARYQIDRVIAQVDSGQGITTVEAKQCAACGYFHPLAGGSGPDKCEGCGENLSEGHTYRNLFRMQNVSTRRRDAINSDEEERQKYGYELRTAFRLGRRKQAAEAQTATTPVKMTYGQSADLWRMNVGYRKSARNTPGFVLDVERGNWARSEREDAADDQEPTSPRTIRVIPMVQDRRNCLLLSFEGQTDEWMATVEAALRRGIQHTFELEDVELASEPLPSAKDRRHILFYEASEGGAGVLRQLVDYPDKLAEVAKRTLALCHFDEDGNDLGRQLKRREPCVAACYDCLLAYTNQFDHAHLDRALIKDFLLELSTARVKTYIQQTIPGATDPSLNDAQRAWLQALKEARGIEPDQVSLDAGCGVVADFAYKGTMTLIVLRDDELDAKTTSCLMDEGWTAIRFPLDPKEWPAIFSANKWLFQEASL